MVPIVEIIKLEIWQAFNLKILGPIHEFINALIKNVSSKYETNKALDPHNPINMSCNF